MSGEPELPVAFELTAGAVSALWATLGNVQVPNSQLAPETTAKITKVFGISSNHFK
jgi:hypothetical protein